MPLIHVYLRGFYDFARVHTACAGDDPTLDIMIHQRDTTIHLGCSDNVAQMCHQRAPEHGQVIKET